jgi:hypothetical protein
MSAFVVRDATMQKVVSALRQDNESCEDADKLGRDLFALNEDAVDHRYAAHPLVTPRQGSDYWDWTWRGSSANHNGHGVPIQLALACDWLKAMHCLRYQCSEGEQFEKTDLYVRLTKRIHQFESAIVCGLPEYDQADWD